MILAIELTVADVLVEQGDCTPACAVAIHSFTNDCMDTLEIIMGGDARQMSIVGFEQMCLVSTAAL